MRNIFRPFLSLLLAAGIPWLAYHYFKPINFLFITGIVLSLVYFALLTAKRKETTTTEENITRFSAIYSAVLFIILFLLSAIALKQYQYPAGQSVYFTNADHYVVENYGIGFSGTLDLYKNESSRKTGLYNCDTGYLNVYADGTVEPKLKGADFFRPVFQKKGKKFKLLNSQFPDPVGPGTSFGDNLNRISCLSFSSRPDKGKVLFSMSLVFTSQDTALISADLQEVLPLTDTLIFNDLSLQKGMDLKNLLAKAAQPDVPEKREVTRRWLEHFSALNLITLYKEEKSTPELVIFAGKDFHETCQFTYGNRTIAPVTSFEIPVDSAAEYSVGLETINEPFQIRKQTKAEEYTGRENSWVLEFRDLRYLPLTPGPGESGFNNQTEIRFLKNNYRQLGNDDIREGFLFNETMKNNPETQINGLLQFHAQQTGVPLEWQIHSLGDATQVSRSGENFCLNSEDNSLSWLFRFRDLSNNPFSYPKNLAYLGVLTLIILALTVITPGKKVIFIETPVLVVIYMLVTFRLLLLWRVSTFPPLENIQLKDFNELRDFDTQIRLFQGIPFTVISTSLALATIIAFRSRLYLISGFSKIKSHFSIKLNTIGFLHPISGRIRKIINNSTSRIREWLKWPIAESWPLHTAILVLCFLVIGLVSKESFLVRLSGIIVPLASFFYFSHKLRARNEKITYHSFNFQNPLIKYIQRFFSEWICSRQFLLALFTLVFLGLKDTGLGVLFLFFLIIKSIFFNFSYVKDQTRVNWKHFLEPSRRWVFGLLSIIILIYTILDKRLFALALENKQLLILTGLVVISLFVFLLIRPVKWGLLIWILAILLPVAYLFPPVNEWTNQTIEKKVRHVVYRTSILFKPVEKMLFDFEYNSGKEQKIIETAQSQWFINSYLDDNKTHFIEDRQIRFRPYFSKGVNYITQTRDVVLPRFVIAEFGGLTMTLMICCFAMLAFLYFLAYRVTDKTIFHASSCTGAMSILLLLTCALFVWLSSTNRFVFFGQDFPFISLASRVSLLFPLMLFVILLLQNPLPRFGFGHRGSYKPAPLVIFFLIIASALLYTGKSQLIPPGQFKIDFDRVENRIDKINEVFNSVQSIKTARKAELTGTLLKENPDRFGHIVLELFDKLYADKRFRLIYDSCSVYEKSILDQLHTNPKNGFQSGYPVHLRYENNRLSMNFNRYFHLELPVYEYGTSWKGQLVQESMQEYLKKSEISHRHIGGGNTELIIIPSTYFPPGTGRRGILNHIAKGPGNYMKSFIYNTSGKQLEESRPESFAAIIDSSELIFLRDAAGNYMRSWTINDYNQPYFVSSYQINGKTRQIYPLGDKYFWIRHYSQTARTYLEKKKDFTSTVSISIDYHLTDSVSHYLQNNLKRHEARLPEMGFSVIAADGNGRIRLMSDFDMKRELIDPNDERTIARKLTDQYFIVNSEAERRQWGNMNLLRLLQGPGSSVKPVVAAAISSQLNLEWQYLQYKGYNPFPANDKGLTLIDKYGGINLQRHTWKMNPGGSDIDFMTYLQKSHNLYHSLLLFMGSYEAADYEKNGNYSLKNLLQTQPSDSNATFPRLGFTGDPKNYYLPGISQWPGTTRTKAEDGSITYFGNNKSLLARGFISNFGLLCELPDKLGYQNQKFNYSGLFPDSMMSRNIWAFPEESFFLQADRTDQDFQTNFINGLINPTLGGRPYQVTPLKMLEMYGKMASFNSLYQPSIDPYTTAKNSVWIIDNQTWGEPDNYRKFLRENILGGMASVLKGGTGSRLFGGTDRYRDYYCYAKTGTIDGTRNEDNSKRLALIISKDPLDPGGNQPARFFVVFFSVNNAYKDFSPGNDKNWYWDYYRNIIDLIMNSDSFKNYMKQQNE